MSAWRGMTAKDLPAVEALATRLHPDHPERPEVFAERLLLAPEGCLILGAADATVLGFALTHPWRAETPPPLDALLGALPPAPDAWHLHDIALAEAARGQGHVPALLARVAALAMRHGIGALSLVAVGGTAPYWRGHGFRERVAAGAALASYGPGAVFMLRPLA